MVAAGGRGPGGAIVAAARMIDRRLAALCFGNFVIGTGTMAVPGALPVLAEAFDVSIPIAGRLIAAFAMTICVFGPFLAAGASRLDRRPLLITLLAIYCASHVVSGLVDDYWLLFGSRVVAGACAGLFTSQAAGAAGLLATPERRGAALAFVFLGWSISAVVGMPLSAWIANALDWRAAFFVVAALALGGAAWLWAVLPKGMHVSAVDGKAWRRLAGEGALLTVVAVTAVHSWAQFHLFAYITPILKTQLQATPLAVSLLLALFGLTGIAGNVIAIRTMDRVGTGRVVLICIGIMLASHVLLLAGGYTYPVTIVALALWGAGCFAVNSTQQARLYALSPALAPVSIALNSSAIYFGQAAGAESGGRVIAASGMGHLPWFSIPVFVAAIALSVWVDRRARR